MIGVLKTQFVSMSALRQSGATSVIRNRNMISEESMILKWLLMIVMLILNKLKMSFSHVWLVRLMLAIPGQPFHGRVKLWYEYLHLYRLLWGISR